MFKTKFSNNFEEWWVGEVIMESRYGFLVSLFAIIWTFIILGVFIMVNIAAALFIGSAVLTFLRGLL